MKTPFQRTPWAGAKFPPWISTMFPPVVGPAFGESPPIDGVPSASSGVSSTSTIGSPPPGPGSGLVGVAGGFPSPLVARSSVLPVGGAGGTSAGGGVSVVGEGTSPVVDLPSPLTASVTAEVAAVIDAGDAPPLPPALTACVRNSSRLPLPLSTGAPLAPWNS